MEAAATFGILFLSYFLGILALVQISIKPIRKLVTEAPGAGKHWETNYIKILTISFFLAIVTTTMVFAIFP